MEVIFRLSVPTAPSRRLCCEFLAVTQSNQTTSDKLFNVLVLELYSSSFRYQLWCALFQNEAVANETLSRNNSMMNIENKEIAVLRKRIFQTLSFIQSLAKIIQSNSAKHLAVSYRDPEISTPQPDWCRSVLQYVDMAKRLVIKNESETLSRLKDMQTKLRQLQKRSRKAVGENQKEYGQIESILSEQEKRLRELLNSFYQKTQNRVQFYFQNFGTLTSFLSSL